MTDHNKTAASDTLSHEMIASQIVTPNPKVALAFILDMRVRRLVALQEHLAALSQAEQAPACMAALSRLQGELLVIYSAAHGSELRLMGYLVGRLVAWLNGCQVKVEHAMLIETQALVNTMTAALHLLNDMILCLSDSGSEHAFWSDPQRQARYMALVKLAQEGNA